MEHNLKGKNILFIYTPFFKYENEIIDELRSRGANVIGVNERPSDNVYLRIVLRLGKKFIEEYILKYYRSIVKKYENVNFDYVFVLKAESYTTEVAKLMKASFPDAVFCRYFWDSVSNYKDVDKVSKYFDRIYTFDRNDSINYHYEFLPLFYSHCYENVRSENVPQVYDFMFAGTVHSDRFAFIRKISDQIRAMGGKCYTWFFFPSKVLYYKKWLMDSNMRNTSVNDFNYVAMPRSEMMKYYEQSRIQLDIQHPKQTGLTMRTIEALGAHKKLITTNPEVVNYDFYRPSNILVVDRKNPVITREFLDAPWVDVPDEIYNKYSITSWINNIFEI